MCSGISGVVEARTGRGVAWALPVRAVGRSRRGTFDGGRARWFNRAGGPCFGVRTMESSLVQVAPPKPIYAHSPRDGDPAGLWEPLADHLAAVGAAASAFGGVFGWGRVAGLAGRLHDIGKCSAAFQAYIAGRARAAATIRRRRPRGWRPASAAPGQALAAVIAGHHAGLADGIALDERLARRLPPYPGWQATAALCRRPPPSRRREPFGRRRSGASPAPS